MLVEIKDERIARELIEKEVAEDTSPLIAYYKEELREQLTGLIAINDIEKVVRDLGTEWSNISFEDVDEQISIVIKEHLNQKE